MEYKVFVLIQALNFNSAYKFNLSDENNNLFEQSLTHILKNEADETDNQFTIIFHSLNRNDINLDKL